MAVLRMHHFVERGRELKKRQTGRPWKPGDSLDGEKVIMESAGPMGT